MAAISLEKVKKVYFGKAGVCACGCAGNYHYAKDGNRAVIGKAVARINEALENPKSVDLMLVDDEFISIEVGNRMITVYFVE